jgi:hypothetical protein
MQRVAVLRCSAYPNNLGAFLVALCLCGRYFSQVLGLGLARFGPGSGPISKGVEWRLAL